MSALRPYDSKHLLVYSILATKSVGGHRHDTPAYERIVPATSGGDQEAQQRARPMGRECGLSREPLAEHLFALEAASLVLLKLVRAR